MRLVGVAALAFSLAACGGDGEELAAGNSQLSPAQVDAALGPADQSGIEDAVPSDNGVEANLAENEAASANASAAAEDEE